MLPLSSESEPAGVGQEGLAETLRGPWSARLSAPASRCGTELWLSQALLPTLTAATRHQPQPLPGGDHQGTCLPEHLRTSAPRPALRRTVSHKGGHGWLEQRRNGPRHGGY